MKILVPIKRVIDYNVKIHVKENHSGVETENVKMSMNPFDAIALEEGIRLKESHIANEIIAITIGEEACQEILRLALAMGADRAIHIKTTSIFEPIIIAQILKKITLEESPSLIILGKQAIDDDCNQTGQMLAGLLNWPQATFASKILIEDKFAIVTREVDDGLETLRLTLPAVITTDLRLNIPRYASLPNIMQAKQKLIEVITIDQLNIETSSHTNILSVMESSNRKKGIILDSVAELIEKTNLKEWVQHQNDI